MVLRYSGFTLLELLIVVSVAAILMVIGAGFVDETSHRFKANQSIGEMQLLLAKARAAALFGNTKVTLCPLDTQAKCASDWNQELTLFTDANHNRQLDTDEIVLQTFPASHNKNTARHFNSLAMGFDGRGFANYYTGSLSYCYKGRTTLAAVFIISRNGRVRYSKSSSPESLPKTAGGQPIPCPS